MRIGLVADTHGLVRPELEAALTGVQLIIHAGDIGAPEVLRKLLGIAPTIAVRGNVDAGSWASELPEAFLTRWRGNLIYVLHDVKTLTFNPAQAGVDVVVSGHSHQPGIVTRQGVLYVNPGSSGPRRFKLPISMGYLELTRERLSAELVQLNA